MSRSILSSFLFLAALSFAHAQMWNGADTLYGNEWINYDQPYFKIMIAEDGVYRIPYETLQGSGLPVSAINGSRYQLWRLGEEQPLYVSAAGPLAPGDFIEFYGQKNRSELDRHLFRDPDPEMLNPWYSLFTDTSAYFLTWVENGEPTLRYEEVENELVNLPEREAWVWGEGEFVFTNTLVKKYQNIGSNSIYLSAFNGDGFASNWSASHDFSVEAPGVFQNGPDGTLNLRMLSNDNAAGHSFEVRVNDELVAQDSFWGAQIRAFQFSVAAGSIGNSVNIKINGLKNNDRYAIAGVGIKYPRNFNFGDLDLFRGTLRQGEGPRYLEIEGFTGSQALILLDLSNRRRLVARQDGSLWKVKLPGADGERKIVLSRTFRDVTTLRQVNFINYSGEDAEFIIISNERLFDDGQGNNWVQEYADYRNSTEGGGYRTVLVEVQQLYDQFAYGVHRTPIGIRNFGHYAKRQWENPKYVLLIGKGREYRAVRTAGALSSPQNQSFYLPTFGQPGSDNLLLAGTDTNVPVIPLGRIAASDANDVRLYLQKVKGFESNARALDEYERAWKKEVIHLGGGGNAGEQNQIKSFLSQMENVIENNDFGANVYSFYKSSSDPIQQSQSGEITRRINEGAAVITFFGHSGSEGFDFSIDDPSTYQNYQRYPAMFSLGCYSGHIHLNFKSVGEHFLFQEDKGAIAFFATVGLGFISDLNRLALSYYEKLGSGYYNKGIGDILKSSIQDYGQNPGIMGESLIHQFTLNGDPSIVITPFPEPDFLVDQASVQFEPTVINAQLDSFAFSFSIENIGKAVQDSFIVEITREFPDGAQVLTNKFKIRSPGYSHDFSLSQPTYGRRAVGFNKLNIRVDAEDDVLEGPLPVGEQNNEIEDSGISFYVFSNGISPVYPPDLGIIGTDSLLLQASTANVFAPSQKYVFEIDTTAQFNSPVKKRKEIVQSGGILEWRPDLVPADSSVYYWRVSTDTTAGFDHQWETASFQYIADSPPGWGQSHFFQYEDNAFRNMELSEERRQFKYLDNVKTIRVRNGVYPNTWPQIAVNNDPYIYIPWDDPVRGGVAVCVLDSTSVDPWLNNPPGYYGSHLRSPWALNYGAFVYNTRTTEARQKLINFLKDTIPSGNYVVLYTIQYENINYEPEEWALDSLTLGTNLFQLLEEQGASLIREAGTTGAKPYMFYYKKDDPSFSPVEKMVGLNESIQEVFTLEGVWYSGTVRTGQIGPAKNWGSLHWNTSEVEVTDQFSIDLYGVRADSVAVLLLEGVTTPDTSINWINAREYPYIRLHFNSADTFSRTSPQLDYWRVLYEGFSDLALAPNQYFEYHNDTLQRGEDLYLGLALANVGPYAMDSIAVRFDRVGGNSNSSSSVLQRYRPLPAGDTVHLQLALPTQDIAGPQQLTIEANPIPGQPEVNRLNNIGFLSFFVEKDKRNPLLDVTFDGRHIVDGELVSAKPEILIRIKDENPFLRIEDTSAIQVFIQYPEREELNIVPFSSPQLDFTPGQGSESQGNSATVRYSPSFTESGVYTLFVRGQDVSGNPSGAFDYKISFQVETKSTISNVLNYPNPFSTSTRFVYTLTGTDPSPDYRIQVMTVSGRVVRELTPHDLGPLKVGTHQTEFAWDGTDEYGDRLANGVYLYRVVVRDEEGNSLEKRDNGTGRFFKNDIGKLVILR